MLLFLTCLAFPRIPGGRIRSKYEKIFKGSSYDCGKINRTDHPAFSTLLVCATDRLSLLKSQLAVNIWELLMF